MTSTPSQKSQVPGQPSPGWRDLNARDHAAPRRRGGAVSGERRRLPPGQLPLGGPGSSLRGTVQPLGEETGNRPERVPEPVRFIQINMQHSRGASASLQKSLAELSGPSVALIQEPWVYKGAIRGLNSRDSNSFAIYGQDPPRAAVICSKTLQATLLPQLSTRDLAVVQATIPIVGKGQQKVIVASAYLPYERSVQTQHLEKVVDFCRQNKIQVILGMDANAHHTVWGSTDINSRGTDLLDFISSTNLELLNQGNRPTFVIARRQEVIDITLASPQLARLTSNWHVSEEDSLSDHRQIVFALQCDKLKRTLKRNPRKTNWATYESELTNRLEGKEISVNTCEGIDAAVQLVQSSILSAYAKACPLRPTGRRQQPPWWNAETSVELEEKRAQARGTLKQALLSKAVNDWETYRTARRDYKKVIREAKRSSWRSFCAEVEGAPEMSRLSKILRRDTCQQLGMLMLPDGSYTTNDAQVLEHMLQANFPGCIVGGSTTYVARNPTRQDWKIVDRTVDLNKVKWAIQAMDPYKSPGPDGIYPIFLQKGIEILAPFLTRIYRASLGRGYVPASWQQVRVVFIPKPGRDSYAVAKAFRPISLSSFLLKGLEKIVDRRLKDTCMVQSPLHHKQHAYQTGKSTETALHCLVERVEGALEDKQYALACFLDIEGAFNHARFEDVRKALVKRKAEPVLVDWALAMLAQREICATAGDSSCKAIVNQGTAQGGVLSALFWVLVVDSLLTGLNRKHFFAQGYSDDITIVLKGIDLGVLCDRMKSALHVVQDWCTKSGMTVNPGKTELMIFTKKYKVTGFKPVKLCGKELQLANQVKYLGVILDSKLTWTAHIEHKCKKASNVFYQCRGAMGKTWGVSPKVAHWIFTAVVRPMLTYGALVWWQGVLLSTMEKKLVRVQRLACLGITGAMCTTPTAAMEIIVGVMPIVVHIQKLAMGTAYRFSQIGLEPTNATHRVKGHSNIWKHMACVKEVRMPCDYMKPEFRFTTPYSTTIPEREQWMNMELNDPQNTLVCWTDGSKCQGEIFAFSTAGAGVFSVSASIEKSIALGRYATVFQAEVYAIQSCAEAIIAGPLVGDVVINTDSQAALGALVNPRITSKVVLGARKALERLARVRKVLLRWVPGHMNIMGNETADELAKAGALKVHCKSDPQVGIAPAVGKTAIHEWAKAVHSQDWKELRRCRQSKQFIDSLPLASVCKATLNLTRNRLRLLVGIITGHCGLNRHLNLLRVAESATCDFCHLEEETAEHFVCSCPAFMDLRLSTFGNQTILPEDLRKIPWKNISKFIQKSARFEQNFV